MSCYQYEENISALVNLRTQVPDGDDLIRMISGLLRRQWLKATTPRAPLQAWTSSRRGNAQLGSTILRVTREPVDAGRCHHHSHHLAVTVIIVIIIIVINLILRQMSDKGTWLWVQGVLMLIIILVTILEIFPVNKKHIVIISWKCLHPPTRRRLQQSIYCK